MSVVPVATVGVRTPSFREYIKTSGRVLVLIAVAIVGMFLPVILVAYAFSDDYPVLAIASGLGPNPWSHWSIADTVAVSGRPIAGLLDQWSFAAAGTIDNLRFVRLAGVVGIAALALMLHWALVRAGIKAWYAALVAVLMCTGAAFQVYASWASVFNAPLGGILSGGASMIGLAAVTSSGKLIADRIISATALLLAALLVYQPTAMFYWVFLAIGVVGIAHDGRRLRRALVSHAGIAVVALALDYVIVKIILRVVDTEAPRNDLTRDPVGKARWFIEQPLHHAANLFSLTTSSALTTLTAAVIVVGLPLLMWRERLSVLWFSALAASLVPLSFLPNLVVAENSPTFRVQAALSALIALYFGLGALGIWLCLADWLRRSVGAGIAAIGGICAAGLSTVFVFAACIVVSMNITKYMVDPQSIELRMIRSQVAAIPDGAPRVGFVLTGWNQGPVSPLPFFSDELGLPSTAQVWTPQPAVHLILRDSGRLPPVGQLPTVDVLPVGSGATSGEPTVNLTGLVQLR